MADHRIRDAAEYKRRLAYLLTNPIRAGLAAGPELYPYSSACRKEAPAAEAAIAGEDLLAARVNPRP